MADLEKLKQKFWDAIKDDRTVMLGLAGAQTHPRPMTAMIEDDAGGPVWFFTATSTELGARIGTPERALMTLTSKGHDVFATVHGTLSRDSDRAVIDRLWNPFIAAWYEGGRDDPSLVLLRFDPDDAEIWLEGSSLVAGAKAMLGIDPKKDYQDKVGEVKL
jgi:general stress protein 26